jgi:hypothetical protein
VEPGGGDGMKVEKVAAKRSRVHTRYKLKNGLLVPGVTTVLGVMNKPALVPWANKLGLQGIEVGKYVDVLAEIGTIAHEMILCHVKNEKFNTDNIPPDLIDKAENSFLSYLEWEKGHKVEPIECEVPLVSEIHKYGGCLDFYGRIDGVLTLKDYKSGKAIWPEHLYQVAAYKELAIENDMPVEAVGILQIGRAEDEGFSEKVIGDTKIEWQIFWHCLQLYRLRKGTI